MWHIVQAEHGAHVLIGTKPGVTKQVFLDAIAKGTVEDLLEEHSVYNGDTFFVPAGTPHTIGPGMVLCEVQEYSDLTYRVYDYGRVDSSGKPRELHVQKALDVMQLGKTTGGKLPPLSVNTAYRSHSKVKVGRNVTLLSACRYFSVERWELFEDISFSGGKESSFNILVVLSGKGQMGWGRNSWITGHGVMKRGSSGSSSGFEAGQCWFVPANLTSMAAPKTAPHATMLRAYVPDLAALRSALKRERHPEAAIAKTVI
jgi:mannose-6-phosphate isomerase